MSNKQKYIGNAKMKEQPSKPLNFKLKPIRWDQLSADLQTIIASRKEGGVALSNEFGDSEVLGITQKKLTEEILPMKSLNVFGDSTTHSICQKTLTDAFNKIWNKIEDITGEPITGIIMTVTPSYFISDDGADVHITAKCAEEASVFEKLSFYINGSLLSEVENTDFYETDTHISETSVIKCVAKIMGIEYERSQVVTQHSSFFLGAGDDYSDVMDVEHTIPITNGMRGKYDVTCEDGDHIIVVVSDTLKEGFIRADMNGFEIPFTEETVTVNNTRFKVFTSVNTYSAGTYNIDING